MFAVFLLGICDSRGVPRNLATLSLPAVSPTHAPKIRAVGIVIAAHNHGAEIARCIASIFAANRHCGWHNSLWIVVVSDRCTDDTAKKAREALGAFGQVLVLSAHSRQATHQVGAATVMDHFSDVPRHKLLLTSTDPSAKLPPDWIDRQIKGSQAPNWTGVEITDSNTVSKGALPRARCANAPRRDPSATLDH